MSSENGWEPAKASQDQCEWVSVPGTDVTLQILKGQPLRVLRAFAADFNAYVEPLRDRDSASRTETNSVPTSNHLNATAMDLNWDGFDGQTFRLGISKERAYPGDRARNLDALLEFYEDVVYCGGYWGIQDWMHFQMGYGSYGNPDTQAFIDRKIRADGYSTYRRGSDTPPAPVSRADGYVLAIIAEGRRRNISPRGIQIALATVLVESGLKMYANSSVPASLNLPHDAVGSDHDSVGLFQQRTPMWGPPGELMDPAASAGLFYARLATMNYNSSDFNPGWYAAEVQRPAVQYRGRYQERMPEAVALYDRLAGITPPPPSGEDDFMSALSPEEQRALYNEIMSQRQSRSPLRHVGESFAGDLADMTYNTDGSVHIMVVYLSAVILGDPDAIRLLREVAAVNLVRYPDRVHDARLAQAMLNLIDGKVTTTSAPPTGQTPGVALAGGGPVVPRAIQPPVPTPTYLSNKTIIQEPRAMPPARAAAPVPPPTAEGGLLGELQSLTQKLQEVSQQVTEITEGSQEGTS